MSALIQNFDTVEKVIETSANSSGSALKENERYLDSIQGKIDQFTNATQSMWSNALDSDVVKGFVTLGTEIIKIIDKIGLLNSALLAFGAYKGFGALFKSLKADGVTLKSVWNWINQLTLATRAQQVADAAAAGTTLSRSNAEKLLNLSIVKRFATEQIDAKVKEANRIREVSLVTATHALALAEKQYADGLIDDIALQTAKNAVDAASVPITSSQIGVTTILGATFKGLAASIWGATKAIGAFLFTNPVGWAILAIGAIAGGIAAWNKWGDTTENLQEKLEELKSDITGMQSELESLNSELETTQERMAELLSKDSLTFTEQEELENLQKQNDLLEREIYLLEQREKRLQKEAQKTFDKLMGKETKEKDRDDDGEEDVYDKSLERKITKYEKWVGKYEEAKQSLVDAEQELDSAEQSGDKSAIKKAEKKVEKAEKKVEKAEKEVDKKQNKVDEELNQYLKHAEGIDYASADEETKTYLDYIYNTEGRLNIANGDAQAKSMEIKRIFNKDDMSGAKDAIDELVKKLAKNPNDQTIIDDIREQCVLAEKDLKAVGLSLEDATNYFTQLGATGSFDTIDGKIAELDRAAKNFETLIKDKKINVDGVEIGLADLFNKEGKVVQTTLSKVFRDTSDQTRQDITKLLEGSYTRIQDGTVDIENLLEGFGLKSTQQVIGIQNKLLGEQNLELFPNLKDEIEGIIDKFDEFSKAVGSVVGALDALEQARAEEAYSGSVSLETLENLMQYTDDYAQLIEVDETGAIRLAANAEEILIERRIQKIKTDAAAAVQTAQANLAQAKYNEQAVNETGPIQNALTSVTDALAGSWAYLGSIIGDIGAGRFSGMFERASAAYSNVTAGREQQRAQVNVSVEDAEKALANALDQQKIANALTPDNIKKKYDSEEASGGNDTKEEVEEDAFQREMDYWENRIAANRAKYEQLQNEIDLMEKKGQKADASFYEEQIQLENERKWLLEQQKAEAQAFLATLEEGSEQWF